MVEYCRPLSVPRLLQVRNDYRGFDQELEGAGPSAPLVRIEGILNRLVFDPDRYRVCGSASGSFGREDEDEHPGKSGLFWVRRHRGRPSHERNMLRVFMGSTIYKGGEA
jgi:hypothetical protein